MFRGQPIDGTRACIWNETIPSHAGNANNRALHWGAFPWGRAWDHGRALGATGIPPHSSPHQSLNHCVNNPAYRPNQTHRFAPPRFGCVPHFGGRGVVGSRGGTPSDAGLNGKFATHPTACGETWVCARTHPVVSTQPQISAAASTPTTVGVETMADYPEA